MAKKRFTDDLFGLFEDPQPVFSEEAPATASADNEETVEVEVPVRTDRARKKLSSKKFTADLDAFLTQDMDRAKDAAAKTDSKKAAPAAPRRRRRTGLDLLIRATIGKDEQDALNKPVKKDTKRVTLVIKKDHILTLKEQAKDRKMYLKDVVQEMVSAYLADQN